MSSNPYNRYAKDDLREEIRREENERSRLQKERDTLSQKLEKARRGTERTVFRVMGTEYPERVYQIARSYGRLTRTDFFNRMRRVGVTPSQALNIVGAVQRGEGEFDMQFGIIDAEEVQHLEKEVEEIENKINEINWELTLKHEAEEKRYVRMEITKYFTYDEPGGTKHLQSPRVRFEVRAEVTVPSNIEPTAEWLEERIEPIFDRAFEELGKTRRQASPLNEDEYRQYRSGRLSKSGWTPQRIGRRYYLVGPPTEGNFINVDAFRKDIQVEGIEEMGMSESFQSILNFKIEKYKLPANTHAGTWFISFSITENQLG